MAKVMDRLISGRGVDVPINLMPTELRARQRQRNLLIGALVAAGFVVLVLVAVTLLQAHAASSARGDLASETREAARLNSEVAALQRFGDMESKITLAKSNLRSAFTGDVAWSRALVDLATKTAEMRQDASRRGGTTSATLSAINFESKIDTTAAGEPSTGTIQYTGVVISFAGNATALDVRNGLAGWLTSMSTLKGLRFVYLGSGTKSEGTNAVAFTATANLTPFMLSDRCQQETSSCP